MDKFEILTKRIENDYLDEGLVGNLKKASSYVGKIHKYPRVNLAKEFYLNISSPLLISTAKSRGRILTAAYEKFLKHCDMLLKNAKNIKQSDIKPPEAYSGVDTSINKATYSSTTSTGEPTTDSSKSNVNTTVNYASFFKKYDDFVKLCNEGMFSTASARKDERRGSQDEIGEAWIQFMTRKYNINKTSDERITYRNRLGEIPIDYKVSALSEEDPSEIPSDELYPILKKKYAKKSIIDNDGYIFRYIMKEIGQSFEYSPELKEGWIELKYVVGSLDEWKELYRYRYNSNPPISKALALTLNKKIKRFPFYMQVSVIHAGVIMVKPKEFKEEIHRYEPFELRNVISYNEDNKKFFEDISEWLDPTSYARYRSVYREESDIEQNKKSKKLEIDVDDIIENPFDEDGNIVVVTPSGVPGVYRFVESMRNIMGRSIRHGKMGGLSIINYVDSCFSKQRKSDRMQVIKIEREKSHFGVTGAERELKVKNFNVYQKIQNHIFDYFIKNGNVLMYATEEKMAKYEKSLLNRFATTTGKVVNRAEKILKPLSGRPVHVVHA